MRRHRDLDRLDHAAGEAQRLADDGAAGHLERDLESAGHRVERRAGQHQVARHRRLDRRGPRRDVERDGEVLRLAQPVAAREGVGDAHLDVGEVDRTSRAGDLDRGQPGGVDQIDVIPLDRVEHPLDRDRSGGADVGRAEDRGVGGCAGVLDQVADAHDVARHRDGALERRQRGRRRRDLRGGGGDLRADQRRGDRQRDGEEAAHGSSPCQR